MGVATRSRRPHGGEPVNPFRSDLSSSAAWRFCVRECVFFSCVCDGRRVLAAHSLVARSRMVVAQICLLFTSREIETRVWLLMPACSVQWRWSHDDTNPAPLPISTSMSRNPSGLLMASCCALPPSVVRCDCVVPCFFALLHISPLLLCCVVVSFLAPCVFLSLSFLLSR